jgi:hypothetical protein
MKKYLMLGILFLLLISFAYAANEVSLEYTGYKQQVVKQDGIEKNWNVDINKGEVCISNPLSLGSGFPREFKDRDGKVIDTKTEELKKGKYSYCTSVKSDYIRFGDSTIIIVNTLYKRNW